MPMVARTQYHNVTSREFLAKAWRYLAEDDMLQASEKGWGAAAQAVKAVAEARGWSHNGHRQLYTTIDRLVKETGDEDIRAGFSLAGALHTNFYEGWLSGEAVESHLDRTAALVEKLEALHA